MSAIIVRGNIYDDALNEVCFLYNNNVGHDKVYVIVHWADNNTVIRGWGPRVGPVRLQEGASHLKNFHSFKHDKMAGGYHEVSDPYMSDRFRPFLDLMASAGVNPYPVSLSVPVRQVAVPITKFQQAGHAPSWCVDPSKPVDDMNLGGFVEIKALHDNPEGSFEKGITYLVHPKRLVAYDKFGDLVGIDKTLFGISDKPGRTSKQKRIDAMIGLV